MNPLTQVREPHFLHKAPLILSCGKKNISKCSSRANVLWRAVWPPGSISAKTAPTPT